MAFTSLRDDDQFVRARGFVRQAERDDASLANSLGARGKFLDFVRIQIASALDDDVLHASGDVDLALGAVGAIAGIYPREFPRALSGTTRLQRFSRFGIAVVAGGRRRAAKPQKAFRAV